MPIREDHEIKAASRPPDEVAQSLAAALLWVDAAVMSLEDGGTSWVRTALLNARTELRGAVRQLRGPVPS